MKQVKRKKKPVGFWTVIRLRLASGRYCRLMLYVTPESFREFFYGSLEGGVGRGSGEARALSDARFSKCRVVVV